MDNFQTSMLTVWTSTYCRPDLVQLLAWALQATCNIDYQFYVVVHPGGLRREWDAVHNIINGTMVGPHAWLEAASMSKAGSVNLLLHDDCVPLRKWTLPPLPCGRRIGPVGVGSTLVAWRGRLPQFNGTIEAPRADDHTTPNWWPDDLRQAATEAQCEVLLNGEFLHLDRSTLNHPTAPYNIHKSRVVEAACRFLRIEIPMSLTTEELAIHPGWKPIESVNHIPIKLGSVGLFKR